MNIPFSSDHGDILLWERHDNRGDKWYKVKLNLETNDDDNYRIVIQGVQGESVIAIDDIKVKDSSCCKLSY